MSSHEQQRTASDVLRRWASPWQRWVSLLSREEAATPLAMVRIGIALITLHTLLSIYSHDLMAPLWGNRADGGIRDLVSSNWLVQQLGGASLDTSFTLMWLCVGASTLLLIGVGSRLAALVALQTLIALFSLHPGSGGGHDRLMTNMLWLLVFARSDATMSLTCWLRHRCWTSLDPTHSWVRWALVFQLSIMYWATGVQKMGMEWMPWGGYEAVYYAVLHPAFARFDHSWVAHIMPLVQLGTAVTWLWEVSFPIIMLWLWARHTRERGGRLRRWLLRWDLRLVYVTIGLSMHGFTWLLMDVGPFSSVTCCFYLCLFHPDEYSRLWQYLSRARLEPEGKE